jgi:hypothetical protein
VVLLQRCAFLLQTSVASAFRLVPKLDGSLWSVYTSLEVLYLMYVSSSMRVCHQKRKYCVAAYCSDCPGASDGSCLDNEVLDGGYLGRSTESTLRVTYRSASAASRLKGANRQRGSFYISTITATVCDRFASKAERQLQPHRISSNLIRRWSRPCEILPRRLFRRMRRKVHRTSTPQWMKL